MTPQDEPATDALIHVPLPEGAAAVARGTARMFERHDIMVMGEVSLRNRRRADLMGVDGRGQIVIVEIKVSRADLLGDDKWQEYLDYCDRFYWAISPELDISPLSGDAFLPDRTGIIVADAYDAEIVRPAATVPLAPARRKTETMRLARRSMRRLSHNVGWLEAELDEAGGAAAGADPVP